MARHVNLNLCALYHEVTDVATFRYRSVYHVLTQTQYTELEIKLPADSF